MFKLHRMTCVSHPLCRRIAPVVHWLCKWSPSHSQLSPSGQTSLEWRIPPPKTQTNISQRAFMYQMCILLLQQWKSSMRCNVLTFRWRLVGCMYWPSVRQSTLASRSSATSPQQRAQDIVVLYTERFSSMSRMCDWRVYTPVRVLSICWSVSPSPSMMDVLVSTVGLTFLACFRTLSDWSKFALGSRTCLWTEGGFTCAVHTISQISISWNKDLFLLAYDFPLVAEL